MVFNIHAAQEPVLPFCALSQQLKYTTKCELPLGFVAAGARRHYVFKKLIEQNSLFNELVSVSFFETLGRFILLETLLRNLRVNFAPGHHSIVDEPVNYVQQRLNIVLVSDLVVLQISDRRKPDIAHDRTSFVFSFRKLLLL